MSMVIRKSEAERKPPCLANQVGLAAGVRKVKAQQRRRCARRRKAPVVSGLQRDVCEKLAARRRVQLCGGNRTVRTHFNAHVDAHRAANRAARFGRNFRDGLMHHCDRTGIRRRRRLRCQAGGVLSGSRFARPWSCGGRFGRRDSSFFRYDGSRGRGRRYAI